ncbi:hypothetical protein OSSY52_17650 [Tepiditoga spiralis]|uniref:Uncharacterized protein n=1 Tax=Tepiditoga spiralis TaxID=2108365 RepID=A0A7G1G8Q5_9BACT|nr:hypothetical protein [Tepiditoga spiralis]BBE31624.1 hypothetical protein OSSY52_17650 [Tepiditoga spiralis]
MEEKILDKVYKIMNEVYPEHYNDNFISNKQIYIEKFDKVFEEIEIIYNEKDKYNLHWAYKNAQEKFNEAFFDIMDEHIKPEISKYKDKIQDEQILRIKKISLKMKKKLKRRFEIFSIASSFVFFIDVLFSIILILIISKLTNQGKSIINSATLSSLFIAFMAFSKITINKFLISPKVKKFGWNMYKKSINKYKKILAVLISILISIEDSISKDMGKDEIKLILKKVISLKNKKLK